MPFTYTPMFRTKAGEVDALGRQSQTNIARLYPVFNITASIPTSFVRGIGPLFTGKTIGLNGLFNFQTTGSGVNFVQLHTAISAAGVDVIPCLEVGSNPNYIAAAIGIMRQKGNRAFIRAKINYLHHLAAWCLQYGITTGNCDLLVDAGHLGDVELAIYGPHVRTQLAAINYAAWRTVSLIGAAAPKDYSALALGPNLVPRKDWLLWQAVYNQLPFQLHYGDHLTLHPDLTEPPGVAMAGATVSVRYSLDADWLIVKGVATGGRNGQPMGAQYRHHAQTLVAHPGFNQLPGCAADGEIYQIFQGVSAGSGSRATWVRIGLDRHISHVAFHLP